jgi:hypothetical protein
MFRRQGYPSPNLSLPQFPATPPMGMPMAPPPTPPAGGLQGFGAPLPLGALPDAVRPQQFGPSGTIGMGPGGPRPMIRDNTQATQPTMGLPPVPGGANGGGPWQHFGGPSGGGPSPQPTTEFPWQRMGGPSSDTPMNRGPLHQAGMIDPYGAGQPPASGIWQKMGQPSGQAQQTLADQRAAISGGAKSSGGVGSGGKAQPAMGAAGGTTAPWFPAVNSTPAPAASMPIQAFGGGGRPAPRALLPGNSAPNYRSGNGVTLEPGQWHQSPGYLGSSGTVYTRNEPGSQHQSPGYLQGGMGQPSGGTGGLPVGGGGYGGGGNPMQAFIDAQNQANARNEAKFQEGLGGYSQWRQRQLGLLDGLGNQQRQDTNQAFDSNRGAITQSSIDRGLTNTTVLDNMLTGNERERSAALGRLSEALNRERMTQEYLPLKDQLDFLERYDINGPNPALAAQLAQQSAAAGPPGGGGGGFVDMSEAQYGYGGGGGMMGGGMPFFPMMGGPSYDGWDRNFSGLYPGRNPQRNLGRLGSNGISDPDLILNGRPGPGGGGGFPGFPSRIDPFAGFTLEELMRDLPARPSNPGANVPAPDWYRPPRRNPITGEFDMLASF